METVDLAFEELGSPDNAPLIILHGFFASSRNWRQVADKLAAKFHVYVLDMRNHGASPHNSVMDYPSMAADLLRFMDAQGLTTASLLGHSMGGKAAMWFALNHPERMDKLVVVDIAPVSYKHCFNNLIQALKSLPLPEIGYRQFLLQNLVLKDGAYCWRIDLDIFYQTAPNIIAFPDVGHIPTYTGKTLFLAGEDSGYIKADDVKTLFPYATLSVIANAGHWLHVQQPGIFIEQVEKFLHQ
jgi:esterase